MAIKSWRRKQLQKPDEFVSFWTRAWTLLKNNAVPVGLGLGAAASVMAAAIVWNHFSVRRAVAATDSLTAALKVYATPIRKEKEEPTQVESNEETANGSDGDSDDARFASRKERAEATLAKLSALEKAGTKLTGEALLLRAAALADLARLDETIAAYRRFLDEARANDPLRVLAYEGLGYALEQKGNLDQARDQFRLIAPGEDASYHDRALWHEGRMLLKQGKQAEAKKTFQTILEKFADSSLRDDVQARLAALAE